MKRSTQFFEEWNHSNIFMNMIQKLYTFPQYPRQ